MQSEDSEPEQHPQSTADRLLTEECIKKWTNEQMELRKNLKLFDTLEWQINKKLFDAETSNLLVERDKYLRYVGGMDISFVKNGDLACSGLFVFDLYDNMKLIYEDLDTEPILMKQPYVPGFLAYREAPFLLNKLAKLRENKPHIYPQCLFIDGNGILHTNKFGMACHIGLMSDTPAIGVSKKLYQVFGLENNAAHKERISKELRKAGDFFELHSNEENKGISSINPSLGFWACRLYNDSICTRSSSNSNPSFPFSVSAGVRRITIASIRIALIRTIGLAVRLKRSSA